ncbi:hypothetical protein B0E33_20870 [Roseibium algicola]|jgi:hypothetical protein|uniref:Uncharacterized protein n=1 Tax=Roseibium algicola TaxID=2857014 RepID=A0ABM6I5S4_9HYPH|nr:MULTISPECIES: hypothetical protein [Stappiaceae]MCR9280802.1 hypothetical protein [Paracoccaceae bacterium]MEC9420114.1 hypothetical protein [Pseudomonadota bacterium]AQQ05716.1 hypothetical protein B0E33_20870 [Roseibium aggregatum]ERP93566.1 hypothetical protein Q669_01605 [Labrenzia sp. C1B10]ERS05609.1 hypothetical protein Q675_04320 [Labrenzia sp. C1B70]
MRTSKKILSTLLTAAFVSGALAGNAFAIDPDDTRGDLNGDKPVSVRIQQTVNAKALAEARSGNLLILPVVGSYNGEERLTVAQQQVAGARAQGARAKKPLHILPFQGDWNGTAKAGFPHK